METKPNYYDDFKCMADKCNHNCCIGWEIDIDNDTLEKYDQQSGSLLCKLRQNIALKPTAHFILDKKERCPFLNKENLCELIIEGGEDMLCQICKNHPRFYNDVYGISEKGIGLSCEEAAKIILCNTAKVTLITDEETPNKGFFTYRNRIFDIIQNREKPISERINELLSNMNLLLTEINWIELYKGLERLDPEWDKYLNSAKGIDSNIPQDLEIPCEQLLCYFIYRHLSGALTDSLFTERLQFAVLSCLIITSLTKSKALDEMLEVARMYSSEIEYSDENVEIILDILREYNEK